MLAAESGIILEYPVDPDMACGGVWVDEAQKFVPVTPLRPYQDEVTGTALYEYGDEQGNVRACLFSVPPYHASRAWEIMGVAAEAGFSERHQTVAGAGSYDHWAPDRYGQPQGSTLPLPEIPGELRLVQAYQAFRVRANSVGVHVLATFPQAPFELRYEQHVDPQTLPSPHPGIRH